VPRRLICQVVGFVLLLLTTSSYAQQKALKVAVASNFYHSLQQLLVEEGWQQKVKLSSGASGLLYAQIKKGAPFDVFLSADVERPELLEQQGLAHSRVTYAYGELVLWPAELSLQELSLQELSLQELSLQEYSGRLVIANPKLAPYGRAAEEVLNALSLQDKFKGKLITASNINQAFQFVDSGNAKLALLARSQLVHANKVLTKSGKDNYLNFKLIPVSLYSPIAQQAVVINRSKQVEESQNFIAWLMSEKIQNKIIEHGYKKGK